MDFHNHLLNKAAQWLIEEKDKSSKRVLYGAYNASIAALQLHNVHASRKQLIRRMEKIIKDRKAEEEKNSLSSSMSSDNNNNTEDLCEVENGCSTDRTNNKDASCNSRKLGRRIGTTDKEKEIKSENYQKCLEEICKHHIL